MRQCPSCGGDCGYTKQSGCQYGHAPLKRRKYDEWRSNQRPAYNPVDAFLAGWNAAMGCAIEVCESWEKQNHVYVNGAIRCKQDIKELV